MAADIFVVGTGLGTSDQIKSVLETVGYDVEVYPDFGTALNDLEEQRPSLVFIDTQTVGFDLGEDIRQMQSVIQNLDFIMIADFQDPLLEREAVGLGVNAWLYQPFTAPEIILKVASVLESASSVGPDGVPEEAKGAEKEKKETAD
ncbi:MAG: hypothetical protein KC931_00730 [Candidatus Omnitrophica bacterium]|nr:hypothetical protein [Candidatus Omnitrophota bacterium]MCA9415960.1 hypothetical protein [Candidatus Omnitrophota bacterium]MCA9428254.1 hypothetical protein [Candidatus Omnitrophota bacterium]MCA9430243.1 hypothetical protein [Candidatus Omnitrophota bacterium]MCA9437248.1 hypothetical protein [Candidatus Omnitrophota bacterium]